MNECCEICGAICEGDICNDCAYRMASHDSSDIWERVQKFDNTDYEIDQVKNDICTYYGCDPVDICKHGRKQPYTQARHLFIYMLINRFKIKQCDVVRMTGIKHDTIVYICHKFDRKFQSNLAVNKVLHLLRDSK